MRSRLEVFVVLAWTAAGLGAVNAEQPAGPAEWEEGITERDMDPPPPTADSATTLALPWMSPALHHALRKHLTTAVSLAVDRLRTHASCRELFESLGADGEQTLASCRYYPASMVHEQGACRGTSALTTLGGGRIYLCRSFRRLPPRRAAVIVLHEALHQSGLNERPPDPEAMESSQINHLVEKSCGLYARLRTE